MTNTPRIIEAARNMSHNTHTAAFALALTTGEAWESLCVWCLEERDPSGSREAHRIHEIGGDCSGCCYRGRDTLVVGP